MSASPLGSQPQPLSDERLRKEFDALWLGQSGEILTTHPVPWSEKEAYGYEFAFDFFKLGRARVAKSVDPSPVPNELTGERLHELGVAAECAFEFDDMIVVAHELCGLVNMAIRSLACLPQGEPSPAWRDAPETAEIRDLLTELAASLASEAGMGIQEYVASDGDPAMVLDQIFDALGVDSQDEAFIEAFLNAPIPPDATKRENDHEV